MNELRDDHLTHLLRSLDRSAEPDPVFAERLFGQLSATAVRRSRGGRSLFVLLAAALMLAAIGAGVAVGSGMIKLPGLSRNPLPVPTASASPTISAVPSLSASAAPTPSASPTDRPTPSAVTAVGIEIDTVVSTTVDGLAVRKAPGTSQESLGTLAKDMMSYVVDGPRQADGYDWYLISGLGLPPESGCATIAEPSGRFVCPAWFGWAAAGDGADRWLLPTEVDCSDAMASTPPPRVQRLVPLACFGSQSLTVRGYWPIAPKGSGGICPVSEELRWLACNPDGRQIVRGPDAPFFDSSAFLLAVPPSVTMPEPGQWIEVTGHYNDPAAKGCTHGDPPEQSVLECRAQFVVDSARPIAAPD
jgi:hypothetical protein